MKSKLILGDSGNVLKDYIDNYFDSCVTDFPYGQFFMGHAWDSEPPSLKVVKEIFRVLKPGAYILCFGGTRTYHRIATLIEMAGFEVKNVVLWLYGSGVPHGIDISQAIDKELGYKRKKIEGTFMTKPVCNESKKWEGYNTAMKPAVELICMARKPIKGLIVDNILKYGVGGLNIDNCRVKINKNKEKDSRARTGVRNITRGKHTNAVVPYAPDGNEYPMYKTDKGRYPSNVIIDENFASYFDRKYGDRGSSYRPNLIGKDYKTEGIAFFGGRMSLENQHNDYGGISRYFKVIEFYVPKPSRRERDLGCEKITPQKVDPSRKDGKIGGFNMQNRGGTKRPNFHPTVKPIRLMDYLVRLVTPKGGIVLDPFVGSGTTGIACKINKLKCVLIEIRKDYYEIAKERLKVDVRRYLEFVDNPLSETIQTKIL